MKTKTIKLFSSLGMLVFMLAFVACNNNSDAEKPNKIISDSNPNLDSVSADILKDALSTEAHTITPVVNKNDN
ncbi:MAG TPA: hypothetical protein VKG26_07205 [Bacteroidia bacterium]|nr:hypothetical protein [Bacteroidia bacterium]